jgi:hypothetical protein
MKIEKVTYQKTYSIGPYLTDRVGFEASHDGNDAKEVLSTLEAIADAWHKEAHPHLYNDAPFDKKPTFTTTIGGTPTEIPYGPPPVIDLNHQRLRDSIDDCQTKEQLIEWKKAHEAIPVPILQHYNERLKQLTNA